MRDVLLPKVKSFDELFVIAERDVRKSPVPFLRRGAPEKPNGRRTTMKFGPYLCFRPMSTDGDWRNELYVKPTKLCLDTILANMPQVDRDMTHFEVIVDADTALVTCSYGLILGACWLAEVDLATVPDTRDSVEAHSTPLAIIKIDPRAGKANCGCVYHAEEGIACEHDIALANKEPT
jgi:hypothetical protein